MVTQMEDCLLGYVESVNFRARNSLGVESEKGMTGGSDSLKERVTKIENFLGIVSGDETECVVTQM